MPYCEHFTETLAKSGFRSEREHAAGIGSPRLHCPHCDFVLYDGPKSCTGTIVVDGTRVLLGKRAAKQVEGGKWDLPGGFMELGESAEESARRETREETGLEIEIVELIGVFSDRYDEWTKETISVFYTARPIGGHLAAGDDIVHVQWFERDALPEDMAFQANRNALNTWLVTLGLPPRYTN